VGITKLYKNRKRELTMRKYNESIENYVANRDSIVENSISIDAGPYTMSNSILELDPLI
jgi:hypothetical protein